MLHTVSRLAQASVAVSPHTFCVEAHVSVSTSHSVPRFVSVRSHPLPAGNTPGKPWLCGVQLSGDGAVSHDMDESGFLRISNSLLKLCGTTSDLNGKHFADGTPHYGLFTPVF